jgi:hypothetical protein
VTDNGNPQIKRGNPDGLTVWFLILTGIAGLAVGLFALYLYMAQFGPPTSSREVAGQFGDYFAGLLNPVLAFLGLIALLYTIHIQLKELRLTRAEMRESAGALKLQVDTMNVQRFEGTFFHLLKVYQDTVNTMDIHVGGEKHHGKACFRVLRDEWANGGLDKIARGAYQDARQGLKEEFGTFYRKYEYLISHYFRTTYNILSLLSIEKTDDKNLSVSFDNYRNLFRAQLSPDEMALLFYDSLHPDFGGGLKRLLDEFDILANWNRDEVTLRLFNQ